MSAVELPVSNGRVTLVDPDVAEKFRGIKLRTNGSEYVLFGKANNTKLLSRAIMNPEKGMIVDHLNGYTLDNRRENLRVCTQTQNILNRRVPVRSKSGFRHVQWSSEMKRWRLRFLCNKKNLNFGTYCSKYVGGIFADQVLVERVGPFVVKNYPEKITSSCLADFFDVTNGRIFKVVFSRRSDGVQREMLCRTGVHSRHNGGTLSFDASSRGLYSVYDVQKKSYRFIPLENVICIRFAKTNYRVVA